MKITDNITGTEMEMGMVSGKAWSLVSGILKGSRNLFHWWWRHLFKVPFPPSSVHFSCYSSSLRYSSSNTFILYSPFYIVLSIGPFFNMPSLNLTSLPPQSSHHSPLTTEATLGLVFGICMAILAVASLWLAWVQWRFQRRNNECESLTDMWQAC